MTRENELDTLLGDTSRTEPVSREAGSTVWLVVDDGPLLETLTGLLEGLPAEPAVLNGLHELFQEASLDEPGCLLLDAGHRDSSTDVVRQYLERIGPRPPTILLIDEHTMRTAAYGMKDGAFDLLEKPIDPRRLTTVVRAALAHDRDVLDLQARHEEHLDRLRSLSAREFQVMKLVVDGKSNKRVARELGISVKTVEAHRARVMAKMGVASVPDLVRIVLQCDNKPGWFERRSETE